MAFGEILKQRRLELGWTREYVAERTHLMVRSIEALETENHKKIPAPIYGRGFIKQYCKALGIDPEPLLKDYNAQIAPGGHRTRTVTHPDVKGPPTRPLEPIHTGAHRTMPPQKPLPDAPAPVTSHKFVEPAEGTFTSVPKPEVITTHTAPQPTPPAAVPGAKAAPPPAVTPEPDEPDLFTPVPPPAAPEVKVAPTPVATPKPQEPERFTPPPSPTPAPVTEPAFTLSGDTLPEKPSQVETVPAAEPPRPRLRPVFSTAFEKEKRERTIIPHTDRSEELAPREETGRRIFGPQEPVKTPPSPQAATINAVAKGIAKGCSGLVTRATRPRVERLHGDEGRYGTPRMYHQALLVFILLLVLTGVIFLFRYIFRLSEAASPEYGLTPQAESGAFKPRPVATPPEAFFE